MKFKSIVNKLQEIIYVSDVETYELYFLNAIGVKNLEIKSYKNKKCYEVLQGKDAPCDFCTNHLLCHSDFYIWEHKNHINNHYYILKDKLILWGDRLCRLEIAIDITEKENSSIEVRQELETANTLSECAKELSTNTSLDKGVNAVLEKICKFHEADRAYIFEYISEKDIVRNTYEYCAAGVDKQIDFLQEVPKPTYWFKYFEKKENVIIENVEDIKELSPDEYKVLKPQGIISLMVIPFYNNDICIGFIGVDNPKRMFRQTTLLESLSYFFVAENLKHKVENQLEYTSYHDALTGVNNRNKYIKTIEDTYCSTPASLGVIFIDLNGLKEINDLYGHLSGDTAIKCVCDTIKKYFKHEDIFRIGGDEFTVISKNISKTDFDRNVTSLQRDINDKSSYNVAIGSVWADKNINMSLMVEEADKLMYADKQQFYINKNKYNIKRNTPSQNTQDFTKDCHIYKSLSCISYDYIFNIDSKNNSITHIYSHDNLDSSNIKKNLYKVLNNIYDNQIHPKYKEVFDRNWNDVTSGKKEYANFEYKFITKDKTYRLTDIYLIKDEQENIAVGIKNISSATQTNQVNCDYTTNLMNLEIFYSEIKVIQQHFPNNKYAVIMMDIDRFKTINDVYGMEIGNKALMFIANCIRNCIKNTDIYAKVYADTFYILKAADNDTDIFNFINTLSNELLKWDFGKLLKSYYGIAKIADTSLSPITICDMANYAHKEAKEKGVIYSFYNNEMRLRDLEIKQIEQEMEKALNDGQFKIYLQPKYDSVQRKVVGAEALVRWHHPNKGLISPLKFIPIFEHNGFIIKLEYFVWNSVCALISKWINEKRDVFPISVNVSRAHLQENDFLKTTVDIPQKWKLPENMLELEFTESIFTENFDHFSTIASTLKHKGITIVMDDFGSGYSSLNLLKRIPVDVIKLDKDFFSDAEATSGRGRIILEHTIRMAKELNIKIVAEGVGIQEQVDFLIKCGCNTIQGYYFCKPVPVHEFEKIVFGK